MQKLLQAQRQSLEALQKKKGKKGTVSQAPAASPRCRSWAASWRPSARRPSGWCHRRCPYRYNRSRRERWCRRRPHAATLRERAAALRPRRRRSGRRAGSCAKEAVAVAVAGPAAAVAARSRDDGGRAPVQEGDAATATGSAALLRGPPSAGGGGATETTRLVVGGVERWFGCAMALTTLTRSARAATPRDVDAGRDDDARGTRGRGPVRHLAPAAAPTTGAATARRGDGQRRRRRVDLGEQLHREPRDPPAQTDEVRDDLVVGRVKRQGQQQMTKPTP